MPPPITTRPRAESLTALLAVAALAMGGCTDGPLDPGERASSSDTLILAFSGDSARLVAMGADSMRKLGPPLRLPDVNLSDVAADEISRVVYALTRTSGEGSGELWAVEVAGLRVRWRERLEDLEAKLADGTELTPPSQLALAADGRRLYLPGRRGPESDPGEFGVVPLDVDTQTPLGYLGGFTRRNRKIAPVRATDEGPQLLVVGAARGTAAVRLMVYRAGQEGMPVVQDSVFLFEPRARDRLGVRLDLVVPFPDGRHVFVRSTDSVFKVDVRAGRTVERAPRARFVASSVAVLQEPVRLVLTDAGSFDFPGSGKLQLYDGELNDSGTIDVGPGAMKRIAVGPRGDRVFVGSGGIGRSRNFDQKARLAVVDVRTTELLRIHDVGGFGFVGPVAAF